MLRENISSTMMQRRNISRPNVGFMSTACNGLTYGLTISMFCRVFQGEACDDLGGAFCDPEYQKGVY